MGRFDTRTRTHGTPKYMMWGKQQLKQPMKRKSMALDHNRKNAIQGIAEGPQENVSDMKTTVLALQ